MDWAERTCNGKLFHARGPATLKALSPSNVRVIGTLTDSASADRWPDLRPIDEVDRTRSKRYDGAMTVHCRVDNGIPVCRVCIQISPQSVASDDRAAMASRDHTCVRQQPVELTLSRLSGSSQVTWNQSGKDDIAVVQAGVDKAGDQRLQRERLQRSPYVTNLAQRTET
jgi:hypothetical protein